MLELPQVTLICLTNKDFEGHKKALEKSCEGITWGAVKLIRAEGKNWSKEYNLSQLSLGTFDQIETILTDVEINNIDDWNKAIIYELHNYISTDFAMLIHADGYVVNPVAWKDEFLAYDYIGAPWPLPKDDYSYRTSVGELVRVGNSVSLRSKKILQLPQTLGIEWKSYYGNTNEDGFLSVHNRDRFIQNGIRFAPLEVAKYFSKEHEIPENQGIETFAFHQVDL